jgi:hypothetical protein
MNAPTYHEKALVKQKKRFVSSDPRLQKLNLNRNEKEEMEWIFNHNLAETSKAAFTTLHFLCNI